MIILLYIACITLANVLTASLAPASVLGLLIPAGTWFIGLNFLLRDFVQLRHGRKKAYAVILVALMLSAVLSYSLGDTLWIVAASTISFAFSETADTEIFSRLRARFTLRVIASGMIAGTLDSALFALIGLVPSGIIPLSAVPLAITGQVVVKCLMQLPALLLVKRSSELRSV